jgi:hypothetical protein
VEAIVFQLMDDLEREIDQEDLPSTQAREQLDDFGLPDDLQSPTDLLRQASFWTDFR